MIASLFFLVVLFGMVVVLPLLVLSLVFRLALGLVLLPFHILGAVFRVFFGLIGGVFRLAFGAIGLMAFGIAALFFFVLLPLAPLFLIVGGLWLFLRALSPARPGRVAVL